MTSARVSEAEGSGSESPLDTGKCSITIGIVSRGSPSEQELNQANLITISVTPIRACIKPITVRFDDH